MEYNFREIEKKWQAFWKESDTYKVSNESDKPPFYVLDMFPYPSGAGLHVGHPLGYIASDIFSRYKRLKGFNVLHPMGFDSFGLPAEQYALETGQHPAVTTEKNIATFKNQMEQIGFCYDWSREIKTSDPGYYKWTQWIFLKLFNSWFNKDSNKAEPIENLVKIFEESGTSNSSIITDKSFSAEEWKSFDEKQQQDILMNFRLAFSSYGEVNWCEALGTVLANDEVVNGVSERGGHHVEKKKMRQWYLRITDYADRLLEGLETVNFSDAMKEMQRNWIGKSEGAEIEFRLTPGGEAIKVYTTRPDTIFGVDFLVIAPEHELVKESTTPGQQKAIDEYLQYVKSRSDRERLSEVKQITGCFTGSYAVNPFNGKKIPVWTAEYVLSGYGTGAIMAVPCGDQRDFDFANHFHIPITNIIGDAYTAEEANPTKDAILENSGFMNGMVMRDAIGVAIDKIEGEGMGTRKVNFRMRDAGFSRQRYWGEPFPIIWKDGIAHPLNEDELPLKLPFVEKYEPGKNGEGPLSNLTDWVQAEIPGSTSDLTPGPSPKERGEEEPPRYITSDASTWKNLKLFARESRKEQTPAEKLLWEHLRNRKVSDCKFIRQHTIEGYIVDFVCIEKKLVIEVDGGYHLVKEQKQYDESRSEFLKDNGFIEIRFSNEEILDNISSSLDKIRENLDRLSSPLPRRGVRGEVARDEGEVAKRETSTMPGYAGSSWYFLRYMDPHNNEIFADKKVTDYWNQVDLYIGGTEHAVGHLLYSRMWTKFLFDLGYISFDEPFKKLINQGMITGKSYFLKKENGKIVSDKNDESGDYVRLKYGHKGVDTNKRLTKKDFDHLLQEGIFENSGLDIQWENDGGGEHIFLKEESEKMSKSKFNVDNPDELVARYGADTFRMYEMFLGPIEQSKPWDTKGIEGVHRFLKKLWRLFFDEQKRLIVTEESPTAAELKVLHRAIKKVEEDIERFSLNTAVSAFMVCVNELSDLKCHKKEILTELLILLSPYAPHIAEELYHLIGHSSPVVSADFPKYNPKYLVETEKEYPVSINGKMRTTINISLDATQAEVEKIALDNEVIQKWIEGKSPKKIIFVKGRMINVVV